MSKFISLLMVTLALIGLGQAFNIPENVATNIANNVAQETGVELRNIQVVKDIRTFIQQHPNLQLIRLTKQTALSRSQSVKYSLGSRVSNDRLIGQYADSYFYSAKKDVSTQVTYPETGTGSVVTAVDIQCLQDNNDGNAFVVAGGIGQRFISIVLEATQTERFTYNVHIFGTE